MEFKNFGGMALIMHLLHCLPQTVCISSYTQQLKYVFIYLPVYNSFYTFILAVYQSLRQITILCVIQNKTQVERLGFYFIWHLKNLWNNLDGDNYYTIMQVLCDKGWLMCYVSGQGYVYKTKHVTNINYKLRDRKRLG